MFKNYLKIAIRNIKKQRIYSLINTFGLAIGSACCVIMLLYVQDEFSFDRFHGKSERIYRLVESRPTPDGGEQFIGYTIGPAAQALVNEFPECTQSVRFRDRAGFGRFVLRHGENRFIEANYLVTEPEFFEIFDFKLLQGNPATALTEPNSILLTREAARKYFGDADAMNQILNSERFGDLKVTGILDTPPRNSHLDFEFIISLVALEMIQGWQNFIDSWSSTGFGVYILAERSLDLDAFNRKLPAFIEKYRPNPENVRNLILQPLHDIHFGSGHITSEHNARKGEISYIYIFRQTALSL